MKGKNEFGVEGKRSASTGKSYRSGVSGKKSRGSKKSLSAASKRTSPDKMKGLGEEA